MKVSNYFENKQQFEKLIKEFFKYLCENEIEIYNEFSFQHELGIFLRNKLQKDCKDGKDYKIEFERNAKKHFNINYAFMTSEKLKKEIDLSIYKSDHSSQFAIELKFPLNGQYPEAMFNFIKDIKFMQELVNQKQFQRTYCITLIYARGKGRPFYKGNHLGNTNIDIYKYFRGDHHVPISGKILKPTGFNKYFIDLQDKEYSFSWKACKIINGEARNPKYKYKECRYYIIECK